MYTIEYRSMTQEEADAILAQLEAVEQSALTDRTIQNLVIERGTSYVKGEQNLEETANEIKSEKSEIPAGIFCCPNFWEYRCLD